MLKESWIPTPLVTQRQRPVIEPIRPPRRWRSMMLFLVISATFMRLWWLRITRKSTDEARALVLRRMLEDLGGVWVKVGQLLGMRRDLFSPDFCDILSELQDHAKGFAFEHTRRIIEEDLERTIEEMYSAFEEEPFAAASIGQIHRATIRTSGIEVAVKIRRPYIEQTVRADLGFVSAICRFAVRMNILPSFRWQDFFRELERTLVEELDYRYEATAIRDMRANLKQHRGMYAPKVFRALSYERVLVMEFVRGALMSDVLRMRHHDPIRLRKWLAVNNIDPDKVGNRLLMSMVRQLFEDNYFHGDLHPGNIVLLRDSRVALIDFGSVGWMEADFLVQYNEMQTAIADGHYAKGADLFLLLGPELPPIDIEPCKSELVAFMRAWALKARTKQIPFQQKSMGHAYGQMGAILARYRIPATWAFLRVNRAQLTLDTSLQAMFPEMNYFSLMRRYNAQAARRRAKKVFNMPNLARQAAELLIEVPALVKASVEQTFYDLEYMRKRARTFQASAGKFAIVGAMMANLATFSALAAVAWIVLVRVHRHGYAPWVSPELVVWLDLAATIPREVTWGVGIFAALNVIQFLRAQRRFRQPEIEVERGGRR